MIYNIRLSKKALALAALGYANCQKIVASDGSTNDAFGTSVAVSGTRVVVGAADDDTSMGTASGSAYVYTMANMLWSQTAMLMADDGAMDDHFATSVGIDGDYAIIGSPMADIGGATDQGAAYIFMRDTGMDSWTQQSKLTASDGSSSDMFGEAVAISGAYAVAGAPEWDDTFTDQGGAYVFMMSGASWGQQAMLMGDSLQSANNDLFGSAVAIYDVWVAVGAYQADVGSNNDQGYVYVFMRSGSSWSQNMMETASDEANSRYGFSVALAPDRLVVGCPYKDEGVNSNAGVGYAYLLTGTVWGDEFKLSGNQLAGEDWAGTSVGVYGDYAVLGAMGDDIGSQDDQGSFYVFKKNASDVDWDQVKLKTNADGTGDDRYGTSIAINGVYVVVGSPMDNIQSKSDQGSAFVYDVTDLDDGVDAAASWQVWTCASIAMAGIVNMLI